jgi:hypothetical protein
LPIAAAAEELDLAVPHDSVFDVIAGVTGRCEWVLPAGAVD